MWVDLDNISRSRFWVDEREIPGVGTLVLVRPQKIHFKWEEDEVHLRSLLCRPDGTVVSSGFPKFFNFGEKPERDQKLSMEIASEWVLFTEKVDGSLIIRDVIDGVVVWRTRGSHELGSFHDGVMAVVESKYPKLLDPEVGLGGSYLFEFISPEHKVCLLYEEADLRFLAMVNHGSQRLKVFPGFEEDGLPRRPRFYNLNVKNSHELATMVAKMQGEEGIVAWTLGEQPGWELTKFKSRQYLALHAMRSTLNEPMARLYFSVLHIRDEETLIARLSEDGVDWELGQMCLPWFQTYLADRKTLEATLPSIYACASEHATRKDRALALQSYAAANKDKAALQLGMALADNNTGLVHEIISAKLCGKPLSAYREAAQGIRQLLREMTSKMGDEE